MPSKRTQRSRDAVSWVLGHLDSQDRFTTHEAHSLGIALESQAWPPYLKVAWRRISGRVDDLGRFLATHPGYTKHPQGMVSSERRGVRVRTQTWMRRNPE